MAAGGVPLVIRIAADLTAMRKNLAEGVAQLETTKQAMTRMTNAFDGTKITADANAIVKAVQNIGGASALTMSEQSRVNKTVGEALEKYRLLGKDAPQAMRDLEKATRGAGQPTDFLSTKMVALGSAIGSFVGGLASRAVSGLVDMGREAIATAGQIVDLSNKTGLSMKTIQEMQYVAGQTGSSLEAFSRAAFMLGARLAGGSDSVAEAVGKLGLNFQEIQALAPEAQFNRIMDALQGMASPQERNNLALQIFGKSAGEILPAATEGYRKLADGAAVAGDAQIKAVDKAADRWDQFLNTTTKNVLGALGSIVLAWDKGQESLARSNAIRFSSPEQYAKMIADEKAAAEAITKTGTATAATVVKMSDYVAELAKAKQEAAGLTTEQRQQITAAQSLGVSVSDIADRYNVSEAALKTLSTQTKTYAKSISEAEQEAKKAKTTQDAWMAKSADMTKDLKDLANGMYYSADATGQLVKQFHALEPPVVMEQTVEVIEQSVIPSLVNMKMEALAFQGTYSAALISFKDHTVSAASAAKDMASGLASAFSAIGPAILGALQGGGNVLKSVGSAFGMGFTEKIFGKDSAMAKSMISHFGENIGGMFNAVLPGIGALAGPLLAGIGKLFGKLFGGPSQEELAGRNAAGEFRAQVESMLTDQQRLTAATEGHNPALLGVMDSYLKAGRTAQEALTMMDRLWRAEKEGPEAVKRVIEEINAVMRSGTTSAVETVGASVVSTLTDVGQTAVVTLQTVAVQAQNAARMARAGLTGSMGGGKSVGGDDRTDEWVAGDSLWDYVKANGIQDISRFGEAFTSAEARERAANEAKNWMKDHEGEVEAAQQAQRERGNADQERRRELGFAGGTPDLGFMDFGAGTPAVLHRREAVVPEGRAGEFAAKHGGVDMGGMMRELAGLRRDMKGLPRMLRAMNAGASV